MRDRPSVRASSTADPAASRCAPTTTATPAPPTSSCSARADRLTTPTCRSIAASTVDSTVAERLLEALNPNEIALTLAAADEVADRHQRVGRAAELAVDQGPLRGRPRRAGLPCGGAGKPLGGPHSGDQVGNQTRRPRRGRAGPGSGPAHAAALAGAIRVEKLAADLSGLWRASTTSNAGQAAPSTRTVAAPAMWSRTATEACAASPDSIASTISECRLTSHCVIAGDTRHRSR